MKDNTDKRKDDKPFQPMWFTSKGDFFLYKLELLILYTFELIIKFCLTFLLFFASPLKFHEELREQKKIISPFLFCLISNLFASFFLVDAMEEFGLPRIKNEIYAGN